MKHLVLSLSVMLLPTVPVWGACPPLTRSAVVVRQFKRTHLCPSTQRYSQRCPGYVVDHIIPRCLDGPDTTQNMQYQLIADAKVKDRLERQACRLKPRACPHQGD